jgi:hypothetical protein
VVVQPGAAVEVGADDLVVERQDGRLVAGTAPTGTMSPQQVIALLRGARGDRDAVQALLDRCAAWESR